MLIGSFDSGDPNTTNLYIGNINPKVGKSQLFNGRKSNIAPSFSESFYRSTLLTYVVF